MHLKKFLTGTALAAALPLSLTACSQSEPAKSASATQSPTAADTTASTQRLGDSHSSIPLAKTRITPTRETIP